MVIVERGNSATQCDPKYYRVYKPELDSVAFDPLDPQKRYHDGIFVETDAETGAGTQFHVTGDVLAASGMRYEKKNNFIPGEDAELHSKTQLGWLVKEDLKKAGDVLRALPRAPRQQGINFWEKHAETGRHELIWVKEDGEPYGPGEERRPTMKCNEWTAQYAIPAWRAAGILRELVER